MALKKVKIDKEYFGMVDGVDARGRLRLEQGKTATIYYSKKRKQLCVSMRTGAKYPSGREKKSERFFDVSDWRKANTLASNANRVGEQAGTGFGSLRKEEESALKIWRAFVDERQAAGKAARNLAEIMREIVEKEREQEQTPMFSEVAARFLDYKERRGCWSENVRARHFKQVSLLAKAPAFIDGNGRSKTLSEITAQDAEMAIEQSVSTRRKGTAISDATRSHWQKTVKEIFAWWYDAANADRPQALQLKNPLRNYEIVSVKNLEEPEIMTVADSRTLLADLWKHDRAAVPAVAVQMFCGVRNAETARVKWKDLRRESAMLYLAKAITKTTQARNVPIPENLAAWLNAFAAENGVPAPDSYLIGVPVSDSLPANIQERRRLAFIQHALERAIKRTGISKPENAFRHTAISAMCVLHNEFLAAQWAGHDRKIQGEFYKAAMSKTAAQDYFGIMPPVGDGKAIAFRRDARTANGVSRNKNTARSASKAKDEREPACDAPAGNKTSTA